MLAGAVGYAVELGLLTRAYDPKVAFDALMDHASELVHGPGRAASRQAAGDHGAGREHEIGGRLDVLLEPATSLSCLLTGGKGVVESHD